MAAIRIIYAECDAAPNRSGHSELGQIACSKGCHWCCYVEVQVNRGEVVYLAETLKVNLDPEGLETIKSGAVSWAAEFQRSGRVICPLNENGICTLYDHRALSCRGFNSADAAKCRRGHERCFAPVPKYPSTPCR